MTSKIDRLQLVKGRIQIKIAIELLFGLAVQNVKNAKILDWLHLILLFIS